MYTSALLYYMLALVCVSSKLLFLCAYVIVTSPFRRFLCNGYVIVPSPTSSLSAMGLDSYTLSLIRENAKLGALLAPSLAKILRPNTQPNQSIIHVLDAVHRSHKTSPPWLLSFLSAKTFSHAHQKSFIISYGGLVSLSHSINSMKAAKDRPEWKSAYMVSWHQAVAQYWHPHIQQGEPHLGSPIPLRDYINKNSLVRPLVLDPDKFGNPPPQINVKNGILKRLVRLQRTIKHSRLIPLQNLLHIDMALAQTELSPKYREAYVRWLAEAYAIDASGTVIKSNFLASNYIPSPDIVNLYKR